MITPFKGYSKDGEQPGLLLLTFSQVTTWIFARSLLNAAILGFYYGIWGTLAYAAYYLSFLTGGKIIDSLRFRHGYTSVQAFLHDRFGRWGTGCYNFVIGLRLISEVFANILVIGILFGVAGSSSYTFAVVLLPVLHWCIQCWVASKHPYEQTFPDDPVSGCAGITQRSRSVSGTCQYRQHHV
ncbi:hypothetical protein [Aliamphritea spongicola]|nr:hypothetical protein [Aliamphritea spongicola]